MCKRCNLPNSVNLASLTAIRHKQIAAAAVKQVKTEILYQTFKDAMVACLAAKTRYEAADRAYSARGETDSPEAAEYHHALDLYKINTLLLSHAAQAYEKGGKS